MVRLLAKGRLQGAPDAIVSFSGFLVAAQLAVSLDVTNLPTSITFSGFPGIVPQGLLLVAPLLLGPNAPI